MAIRIFALIPSALFCAILACSCPQNLPVLITANCGRFETFAGVPYTEESMKKFLFNVPLGRLSQPSDIANYCLFLASDEARFVTGTCLEIDGGRGI